MRRSADILKEARSRAGMTQVELSRAAGVTQSVVSAYETGQREPGLPMLAKLVRASGHELVVEVSSVAPTAPTPAPDASPVSAGVQLASTELGRRLLRHRQAVVERAGARGARNVRVFGSVARGECRPDSDMDLLVDLEPGTGLFALLGLQRELAELLGVAVDVVPGGALKGRYRDAVLSEAQEL